MKSFLLNKIIYKLFIAIFLLLFNKKIILKKFYNISTNINIKLKICMCITGKKENKYIIEFIEHYKKYGVDKIFLYDNNEKDDEKFEDILSNYIQKEFVEIINYRGEIAPQIKIYNDCYKNNYKNYDWLIFYDIDEFIYLKNYMNIKLFLNEKRFSKCQRIALNWVMHSDNNLIYYDNRSLFERFPEKENIAKYRKTNFIGLR